MKELEDFDAALVVGQEVEARWTNNFCQWKVPARITKLNARTLCVSLLREVRDASRQYAIILYPVDHIIRLARPGNRIWSVNNCAAPAHCPL